eukprot:gene12209-14420_t
MGCGPPIGELREKVEPLNENCQNGLVDIKRIDMHPPAKWPEDKGHIVSMFREPKKLKISFIMYLRKLMLEPEYAKGCGVFDLGFLSASGLGNSTFEHKNLKKAFLTDDVQNATRILQGLVSLLVGCQTKMILGYHCLSDVALSSESLQNATAHLSEDFAFVGLVEKWVLSVRLFGSMFEGTRDQCLLPGEVMNGRAGNRSPLPYDLDFTDPYDSSLYIHAQRIFHAQLSSHPIQEAAIKDLVCPSQ